MPFSSIHNITLDKLVETQQGMRLKMSKERASKLDSIGFAWGMK